MVVRQILNNNVAVVKRGNNEVIVYAKGIAFRKKVGDRISEEEIQRTYVLDSHDMLERFSYLINKSSNEDLELVQDIMAYAEQTLAVKVSGYLNLALLDHMTFLSERSAKSEFIKSPLTWDVKKFYPSHFEIGLFALREVKRRKGVTLPQDEAVSIALHFINMETDGYSQNSAEEIQAMSDVISIINLHFKIKLDEESTNYLRLVTHLKYFIQRIIAREIHSDDHATLDLYQQVSQLYPESFQCVQKIRTFIAAGFGVGISISEETYLMLHINRVTARMEEK